MPSELITAAAGLGGVALGVAGTVIGAHIQASGARHQAEAAIAAAREQATAAINGAQAQAAAALDAAREQTAADHAQAATEARRAVYSRYLTAAYAARRAAAITDPEDTGSDRRSDARSDLEAARGLVELEGPADLEPLCAAIHSQTVVCISKARTATDINAAMARLNDHDGQLDEADQEPAAAAVAGLHLFRGDALAAYCADCLTHAALTASHSAPERLGFLGHRLRRCRTCTWTEGHIDELRRDVVYARGALHQAAARHLITHRTATDLIRYALGGHALGCNGDPFFGIITAHMREQKLLDAATAHFRATARAILHSEPLPETPDEGGLAELLRRAENGTTHRRPPRL
ncbi:hypothetical protein [Streptomyces sp. NPDC021622]|uniref:hypothetical protein n=1 Tax=Streptomyces sp. NPDC021622 TaxID=3155013 RepID=UPI0033DDEB78